MSTLLPSFIVFLELKQAKFFWSVLLIFGKTEAFLFHFLYSACLSLTHSVLHGLYIVLYIWDAVFSMCGTNFHNGGAYNRTVGLGSHFLCLLRGGDAEAHCTWNVLCSFTSFTIAPISVVIRVLVRLHGETQYTKPFASFAIRQIRSWDVGAIRKSAQTILFARPIELLFFLKRYIRKNQSIHSDFCCFPDETLCSIGKTTFA